MRNVVSTWNKWKEIQRLHCCTWSLHDATQEGRTQLQLYVPHISVSTHYLYTEKHGGRQDFGLQVIEHWKFVVAVLFNDRGADLKAKPGVRRYHVVKQLDHFLGSHLWLRTIVCLFCVDSEITLTTYAHNLASPAHQRSRMCVKVEQMWRTNTSVLCLVQIKMHCKIKTNLELSVVAPCVTLSSSDFKFACKLATVANCTAVQWHWGGGRQCCLLNGLLQRRRKRAHNAALLAPSSGENTTFMVRYPADWCALPRLSADSSSSVFSAWRIGWAALKA